MSVTLDPSDETAVSEDWDDASDETAVEPDPEEFADGWLNDLLRVLTNEQIADTRGEEVREWFPEAPDGRAALIEWIADRRDGSPYADGPLAPEEQADEHNMWSEREEATSYVKVEDGSIVRDVDREQRAWALDDAFGEWRRREAVNRALAYRLAIVAVIRPLARARGRTRRAAQRRSARSPGARSDDGPEQPPLGHPSRASRRAGPVNAGGGHVE